MKDFHQHFAQREIHFEKGPIIRSLLLYTAPVLLSQLFQQVYNITDSIIVGHFGGEYGLAATGLGGLILSVLINFFIGFSTGAGIQVAQEFGAYDYHALRKTICTMINVGILLGAALTAAGVSCSRLLLKMTSCPAQMLDTTDAYLSICFLGLMPQLVYNIGNAALRSLGDTRSSLYYLILSCAVNLELDILTVIGMDMGIRGAAISTVISQWILLFVMLRRLSVMDEAYAYRMRSMGDLVKYGIFHRKSGNVSAPSDDVLSFPEFRQITYLSLPSGLQAVFMSISSLVLQVTINSFGPAAVAGMTVYGKMEGFLYYPAFSYGIALTGFVGQNVGAGCMDRVRKAVRSSLMVCSAIILLLSLVLDALSGHLLPVFTTDPAVIANGSEAIHFIFPLYFLYMINQIYLGAVKGLGRTVYPMICTMVCYCFFRVAWCAALIGHFHSMKVVYTSYDVSWVILLLMIVPYYWKYMADEKAWNL